MSEIPTPPPFSTSEIQSIANAATSMSLALAQLGENDGSGTEQLTKTIMEEQSKLIGYVLQATGIKS